MTPDGLLAVLQFADGLFPAGGFAHSLGLETYVQAGVVRDRPGLEAFLVAHLEGSAGPTDAVAVAVAARAAAGKDLPGCLAIDGLLDAAKCVAEFREASTQMGRQVARVGAALLDDDFAATFARAVDAGQTPGHHPVVFGVVTRRAGVDPESAALAYLYATVAQLTGAALRLMPLGQLEAQRVLAAMRPRIRQLAAAAAGAQAEDMWSFAPGLEIAGWRHAQLEARLFRS